MNSPLSNPPKSPKIIPRVDSRVVKSAKEHFLFLEGVKQPCYSEIVYITLENGERRTGQILEVCGTNALVQVFEGTNNIKPQDSRIEFTGSPLKLSISEDMIGRVFDGFGHPRDGGPHVLPEKRVGVEGRPVNPYMRSYPGGAILTGISGIDIISPVIMGTKMPIFTEQGVPYDQLATQICRQSKVINDNNNNNHNDNNNENEGEEEEENNLVIIFAGIGVSHDQAQFFMQEFFDSGTAEKTIMFLNLDTDPTIERVLIPQTALTVAEFFALEKEKHVLVVMSDMRNYINAVRELRWIREEVQGPINGGTIYSDLSKIYERAGRFKHERGSITILPFVTFPNPVLAPEDPLVDSSGFLSDGCIYLSGSLHRKGIYPPISPSSYSRYWRRVMEACPERRDWVIFGTLLTRKYYEAYDLLEIKSFVDEEMLSDEEKLRSNYLKIFQEKFLTQGTYENRILTKSLSLGWETLRIFPFESFMCFPYYHREFFRSQYYADDFDKIDGIAIQRFTTFVQNNNILQIKRERFNDGPFPRVHVSFPVHSAVMNNLGGMVKYLISQGMDENAVNEQGRTPLHLSAMFGFLEILKILLKLGADVSVYDGEGLKAVDWAKKRGHEECWETLIYLGKGVKKAY